MPSCRAEAPHRSQGRAAHRGDNRWGLRDAAAPMVLDFETATLRVRQVKKRHSVDARIVLGCDGAPGSSQVAIRVHLRTGCAVYNWGFPSAVR